MSSKPIPSDQNIVYDAHGNPIDLDELYQAWYQQFQGQDGDGDTDDGLGGLDKDVEKGGFPGDELPPALNETLVRKLLENEVPNDYLAKQLWALVGETGRHQALGLIRSEDELRHRNVEASMIADSALMDPDYRAQVPDHEHLQVKYLAKILNGKSFEGQERMSWITTKQISSDDSIPEPQATSFTGSIKRALFG
jgi:hypothetical protein